MMKSLVIYRKKSNINIYIYIYFFTKKIYFCNFKSMLWKSGKLFEKDGMLYVSFFDDYIWTENNILST